MRWMHPPERARARDGDRFDPAAEGARHGLSAEVTWALWRRGCAAATDAAGRLDAVAARRRFAALIASGAGRQPEVGRVTRIDVELAGTRRDPWGTAALSSRVPGRETRVALEAERRVVHRQAVDAGDADPEHPAVHAALVRRGGGVGLPDGVRRELEAALGTELDGVRVHTDDAADQAAGAIHARAFTVGDDIYFARGELAPETTVGRRLLAHELAHVVQGRQGRMPAVSAAYVSRPDDALEREADAVAERVSRVRGPAPDAVAPGARSSPLASHGRGVAELFGRGPSRRDVARAPATGLWRTPHAGAAGQPATAETPVAMSVALAGMLFTVPENVRFRAGQRLEQGLAIVIRRLIGGAYQDGMERRAAAYLRTGELHSSGSLGGVARGGELIGALNIAPDVATRLIGWLEAQHVAVELSAAQRELLALGGATTQAWQGFPARDLQELATEPPPRWYRHDLFVAEVARYGSQLRAYVAALERFRASQAGGDRTAAVTALRGLLDAVNGAARVLELIRGDAALIAHDAYRALWPQPAGQPPRVADPASPPRARFAELFLIFARTQPALAQAAATDAAARRELLDRFARFMTTAATGAASGDQAVQDHPGRANAPAHPSQLSSYPALQPPLYEAALQTDHRFSMALQFPSVFDAFAHYSYFWERVRIPDSQIGGVTDASALHGARPGWGEVGRARMARASRYARADLGRAIGEITDSLGTAGLGALEVAAAAAIFRYVGSGLRLAFEILTRPDSEQAVVFPEEGLYLIRCRAVPIGGDNDEVVRAPSVAYLPVFARSGARIAETQVHGAADEQSQALARIAELDSQLHAAGELTNRAELEAERAQLAAAIGSVPQRIAQQQRALEDRLRGVPAGSPEAAAISHQLEALRQMTEVRASRAADLAGAEVLNATFVSDDGQTLRLLMEAAPRPPSGTRQHYYVSDVTTPNSTHANGSGPNRAEAILDGVRGILEAGVGAYGRGNVAMQLDGRTYTRRIEAGEAALLMETIENVTTVISIAAVAAAPFTGGASLAILLPVGAIGAIPSAFRLASRAENGTLRLDLASAMDVVNIAGGLIGLGQAATPLRMVRLSGALMIAGVATNGAGMLLMGVGMVAQIEMLADLPAGLRAARLMEIIGQGMIAAGLTVGTVLAQHAQASRTEAAITATDEDPAARGISDAEYDAEARMSGQRGRQGPMRSEQLSLEGVEVNTEFAELSARTRHFVRQMERRGWVRTSEISPAELTEISRWFGREIGVVQHPETGRLRLILGTRNGVLRSQVRPGEIFLVHTHPVMISETGHFSGIDIPSAGLRVEAVVDWSGQITYFNRDGVLNPRMEGTKFVQPMDYDAGFMNAQGTIVGYGTIRWVALGNGQFQVQVR